MHHLLRNPYFKGTVVLNGAEHEGTQEPQVDPVTWATVQDILTAHRNGERSYVHDHYVYCIVCGRRLIAQNTRSKNGRTYRDYVCVKPPEADCHQRKALPMLSVEDRVADRCRTIALTQDQRERIEQIALARLRGEHAANQIRAEELTAQAEEIASKQETLLDVYYSDTIPRDLFTRTPK